MKLHHNKRLDEAADIVKTLPGLTAYEIAGHMTWNVRGRTNDWEDFPLAQKWFAVGECLAHLDYLRLRNKLKRTLKEEAWRYFIS